MSVIADVHVGEPNDSWPLEERVYVHFHNFADLPQQKGTELQSSKFTCAGHEWYLKLYPKGTMTAKEGMLSVVLCTDSTSKIVVDFDIITKKNNGGNFRTRSYSKKEFPTHSRFGWGWEDFASRDEILRREEMMQSSWNVLNNGTLTFEVRIRPHEGYNICCDVMPKSSVADDLYNNLYQDEDSADVAFSLESSVFHAHKAILKARVPELAEIVEPYDTENTIPIKDVEPEVFEVMLKHVYGKDIGLSYWKDHLKQILDASGKYGFTQIKSQAEAWYVKKVEQNFTVDNVIDELLYADGKNCPLLKKAAMDFIVEHCEEIVESESYEKLDESPHLRKEMVKEVTKAFKSHKKRKRDD
eukprot:scaffold15241_cov65-Cyclotella_meneghiniana.AAC.2